MMQASSTGYLARLFKLLTAHFNLDELRTLCFDLNVDYDTLRGEEKATKALELISLMLREHRLNELVSTLRQQRPGADWPTEAEQPSPDELLAWATPGTLNAADYLAALRDYCANPPYLTLHDIRPPKTLDEVYVPLKARPQPRKDEKPEHDEERARRELERSEPLSIADVMRKHDPPHVLILGEPGAGKSTLLRQLAEHAWNAPEKIGLDAPHLPILVPLRRLAAAEGALEERLNRALAAELTLTQALPQGFFTNWPQQTGANWLILLDALDEVPAEQRAQLMQWLKGLLVRIGQNRVVLTSRPSGYTQGELDDKLFGHYDLLSFTPDQTSEFAHKWFEEEAEQFLKELDCVRAGALGSTPLLLTIAAKVYLEKGTLPERRSGLYGQFVDIWLAEAEQRGLRAELGEPVCDVAKSALARLALAMTEQPSQTEASLSGVAADYLRDAVHLTLDQAEIVGERSLKVMARRSGVFTRRGDEYDFIHPTFREYLAACAVVRESKRDGEYNLEQVWQQAVSRWVDNNWREVALFALSALSDEGQDVTPLVKHIWGHGLLERLLGRDKEERLYFAGATLAEQVKVDESLSDSIIDGLFTRALKGLWDQGQVAFGILGELRSYPRAGDKLLTLVRDKKVNVWVHESVTELVGKLGRADDLVALARDKEVYWPVRKRATEVLDKFGWADEAAQAWLALARDEKVYASVREKAAEALGKLRRADDLLALARDEKLDTRVRLQAAVVLGETGRVKEAAPILLSLARDEKVDGPLRIQAATALGKQGWIDDAVSVLLPLARRDEHLPFVSVLAIDALGKLGRGDDLLALARDEKVNQLARVRAVGELVELKRGDDLLALARDEKVGTYVRVNATEALGKLGRADDLLALARDDKVGRSMRGNAAEALGKLRQAEEAAQAWLARARDEKVKGWTRVNAAEVLGRLGRTDDLLALARDEKVDGWVRERAAKVLGWFADARVLPDLERLAQEDKDKDVRRAAQRAIVWIRGRA